MENNNVPSRELSSFVVLHDVRLVATISVVKGRETVRNFMIGNDPQGFKVPHDPAAYAGLYAHIENTMDDLQKQLDEGRNIQEASNEIINTPEETPQVGSKGERF